MCFSLHDSFQNDAILERVSFWLRFLSTFSDHNYQPPVILVGTHLDKVPKEERDVVKGKVLYRINRSSSVANAFRKHVTAFTSIDNTLDDVTAYDKIWCRVLDAARHQSHWGQLLPASWITLELDFMLLKGQGVKVMTLKEVKMRARQLIVPLDEHDVIAMLKYLHMIRNVLCFQLDDEDDEIIIDPQWLIEAFKLIVTTLVRFQQHGHDSDTLENYGKTGVLTLDFIEKAWANDTTERFLEHRDTILLYLDRLELIVKPLPKEQESSVNFFFVPCLLTEATPDIIKHLIDNPSVVRTSTLCFDFRGSFIPPSVHNKILASCIHRFEVMSVPGQPQEYYLQQGLGCFILSHYWKMAMHCKDSKLKVTLFSDVANEVRTGDGFKIREIIKGVIEATLEKHNQGHLMFDSYISEDFEVKGNEENRQPTSESTAVWFSERENEIDDSQVLVDTRKSVSQESDQDILQRTPNQREVIRIAKHIGNNYILFFIDLGMSDIQVEQIRRDHEYKRDFLSQVTRIIFAWKNEFEEEATFQKIKNAFEFCNLDFTSLLTDIRATPTSDQLLVPGDIGVPMSVLNSSPLREELESISLLILKSYFIVFVELGVTQEAIELAEMDHHKALDMISNLLQHWLETFGEQATIAKLYFAFKECRKPCAKLIDLLRHRIKRNPEDRK
ncbi:uncharacterized protein [Argopecten irradians]|uniref:uncharacterized protein n=1 Tax=Argopecten irradians TaxID=31199 RepID=UPI0037206C9A